MTQHQEIDTTKYDPVKIIMQIKEVLDSLSHKERKLLIKIIREECKNELRMEKT